MKRPPATKEDGDSASQEPIRLLLHCTDGVVPFLTPHLLEKCFPVAETADALQLGLSVKETCVVPVYKTPNERKKTRKVPVVPATTTTVNTNAQKPRGYTFSNQTKPDPWLQGYTRVTVPTFCLQQDAAAVGGTVTVTSQHVLLWTANGRTALTPALYHGACATGLQSDFCVPLFDTLSSSAAVYNSNSRSTAPATTSDNDDALALKRIAKKKEAAVCRTRDFTSDFLFRETQNASKETTAAQKIWAPLLVDDSSSNNNKDSSADKLHQQQMDDIVAKITQGTVAGLTLIGWHDIPDTVRRRAVIERVTDRLATENVAKQAALCLLVTDSLQQVIDATVSGVTVIGSRLPTVWAQSRKVLLCNVASWKDTAKTKRPRLEENGDASAAGQAKGDSSDTEEIQLDADGCLDLTEHADDPEVHAWFRDQRPLMQGCECLTCRTHSRSYIYHLVCAKELTSEIMLFIHNLHQLLLLVRAFTKAHACGQAEQLYDHLREQLGKSK